MLSPEQPVKLCFRSFELDLQTGELHRDGRRIKLQDQPGKLLALLASRPGELVTRAEIEKALWADGEFVEFEHAINTAMRKVRDALGDDLQQPSFIETVPRKGYRFIAPVERPQGAEFRGRMDSPQPAASVAERAKPITARNDPPPGVTIGADSGRLDQSLEAQTAGSPGAEASMDGTEFTIPRQHARLLFLLIQCGYLAIYCAALYKAESVEEVLARLLPGAGGTVTLVVLIFAMCGIAVRLYLIFSVGLNHPAAGGQFRRLFPVLFFFDTLWAMSPLLLARQIGYGPALGAVAALAYLPFAQRTLLHSVYAHSKHGPTV